MEIITPNDFDGSARKRKRRTDRPCDACRRRKSRCVTKEDESDCMHCQLRCTACTYDEGTRPRTAAKATASETRKKTPSRATEGFAAASPSRASQYFRPINGQHQSEKSQSPSGFQITGPPSNSTLRSTDPGQLVPGSLPVLGLASERFAELYGLGSDMEPILMRHRPYDKTTHEFSLETHSIRRVAEKDNGQEYPLTFHMAADNKAIEGDPTYTQVDAVEACVSPHGPSLLDLFWRQVQPCYPILSKDTFAHAYSRSYRHIPAALLGAIYLCAMRWWTYDPELSIRSPPDGTLLRKLLKESLPSSYHRPKLSSIQAALLLLQCQPEDPLNPDHTYQWGITCQALAVGQCLGLHLDATNWSIPPWERNLRKRLSWALYMQDRWTALAYGRPVHIHEDDWTVPDLTHADFTDDDTIAASADEERKSIGATGRIQFMQMVSLAKILSSVLSTFYTAKASREQDTVILHEKAYPLLQALNNWYSAVPASLQMEVTYQRKLCFHGHLHFSYYGVVMAILRRLVRSTALPPRCLDHAVLGEIRQISLETAQCAIAFVTSLRPDHIEAFWYFTSPYLYSLLGSFTTLLLVTSLSTQERGFWQESLNSYLWTLRMMSKSCEPMQYAVNRLEGAILRGLEHALAVNLNEPVDDEDVSPMMANYGGDVFDFTDFGDWDLAATGNEGAFDLLSAMALQPGAMPGNGNGHV
ncbi:fungal-specific transcription factor domain-containing protein [Emericellopsis atlantica]|uniref:Fungal-specific transcription factor domain-containing protein n=1 Tax=Emericellopsis atlantica TaxID=2614577 RepID=A0A9P7ZS90_9HYPO|nr:fungal-specific transcription factor domain-containing protein [Emericellopsis atlantica]KAG9257374.1 fungal-specific transcription factor domain-containing protein [Emericellopsis atlantica]